MASIPTPATVEAEIDAVTLGEGLASIESLARSLMASGPGLQAGTIIKLEDLIALIDPALIPVIGGIRKILPLLDGALAALEPVAPASPVHPSDPQQFSRGR